jgi:hypothetical protein
MSENAPAEPTASVAALVAPAPADAAGATAAWHAAAPSAAGATRCENCGAPLAGRFCSECGQRHHEHAIHHFWQFIGEAAEDLTHADSRLWQTLSALLFRPGFLTREFLDGRRVRYLPPVRLYLVVSVIFFILGSLSARLVQPMNVVVDRHGRSFQYRVVPAGKAPAAGAAGHEAPDRVTGGAGLTGPAAGSAREHFCEASGSYIEQHGGWLASLGPRVTRNCLAASGEGGLRRLNEAVEHNLERAMFLFLPLLALAMKPLYRKPPRHYVEHLLFFVHTHAFLFAVLGFSTLLEMVPSLAAVTQTVDAIIAIYIPIYFYLAMRRVYGQGRWRTLGKLTALAFAYCLLGAVMLIATASYSFLML